MPSIASSISAASSYASSQPQPPAAAPAPESGAQPFAALLDATMSGTDVTDSMAGNGWGAPDLAAAGQAQANGPAPSGTAQSADGSSTAEAAANSASGHNLAASSQIASVASQPAHDAAVTAGSGANATLAGTQLAKMRSLQAAAHNAARTGKTAPGTTSAAATDPSTSQTATASADAASGTSGDQNASASAASAPGQSSAEANNSAAVNDGTQTLLDDATDSGTPGSATKPSSNRDGEKQDGADGAATNAASTGSTGQPSPIAAAVVTNSTAMTVPASGPGASSGTAIGDGKSRGKFTPPSAGNQDVASSQSTKDAATRAASTGDSGAPSTASADNGANDPTANNAAAPQAQPSADGNAAGLAPVIGASGGASSGAAPASFRSDPLAATATSDAAGSSGSQGTAKTNADGVPNFGFAAAPGAAPALAAAPATAAAAAAVPVSGLAVAIASRAQAGSNQFDIRLDPPELGRIDVRLSVDGNGQVTSHVTVDRADTLQLLQSQQPQLERAIEQAGLRTADNGLQFSLRDQSFSQQNTGGGGQSPAAQLVIPDAELPAVQSTQIYSRLGLGSGLDIRV